jgi:SAM-dependent methyltransferase
MSRDSVVAAYATWTQVSAAEEACIAAADVPARRILDLGCGAGRFATKLGRDASHYLGIDASAEMIAAAQANCPELEFREGNILEFDAGANAWDLILLMGNVLDYLQPLGRRARLLDLCHGWLRPGGSIIGSCHLAKPGQSRGYYFEDYHGASVENHRASLGEIVSEVESHGFEIELVTRDYRDGPAADWCYWLGHLLS